MSASWRRIWIQLTADRRRFGVLCAVLLVGLLLWARLIIVSNMPRTAVADSPVGAAAGAPRSGAGAEAADKSRAGIDSRASKSGRNVLAVEFHHRTQRDPFVISPRHFPKPTPSAEMNPTTSKLSNEPAEDASQKEARLVARLLELLGSLKLEAVFGSNLAVISGRSYRIGDSLPPLGTERAVFTLAEVRQRSVVFEHQGLQGVRRFELEMAPPR